jgi:POT family proton-dependent oligopeptide transporter
LKHFQAAGLRHDPALADTSGDPKRKLSDAHHVAEPPAYVDGQLVEQAEYLDGENMPTEEEMTTLRRIPDKIPWRVYTIGFVELVERLSYYGTTAVFQNFIQQPRETATGRAKNPNDEDAVPGALDKGKFDPCLHV